jgi:hypothetical protein
MISLSRRLLAKRVWGVVIFQKNLCDTPVPKIGSLGFIHSPIFFEQKFFQAVKIFRPNGAYPGFSELPSPEYILHLIKLGLSQFLMIPFLGVINFDLHIRFGGIADAPRFNHI